MLTRPSIVAVVSVSPVFLEVARGVLAPALGRRHQLREVPLKDEGTAGARGADLVFCDSIAHRSLRSMKAIPYRLLSTQSIESVAAVMASYRE